MTTPVVPHMHSHPNKQLEAYSSMGLAAILAIGGGIYFFLYGGFEPKEGGLWYYALAWMVLGYLAIQLVALLSTAIDTTSIGFGDMIFAIIPAIVGIIAEINHLQGLRPMSTFSQNALLLMICTSALESLITLWVRFTVNRKTTVFDTST